MLDEENSISTSQSEAVLEELERIYSSRYFRNSPRLQEFLRYVVVETLEGRADQIKAVTIAQDVFQRDSCKDEQATAVVRVEAGRLRRYLEDYYNNGGQLSPCRIHMAKGGYVPSFESAPSTNKINKQTSSNIQLPKPVFSILHSEHKACIIVAFLAIALTSLLGLFLSQRKNSEQTQKETLSHTTVITKPAIAVLPFKSASDFPSSRMIAIGLTEDIITELSKLSGIDVIAMSSILTLKKKNLNIQNIGIGLRVNHILRGTLRKTKQGLRVTSQLVNVQTGKQIWAEKFDRSLDGDLGIQSELAVNLAQKLAITFGDVERHRLTQNGAYTPKRSEARALYKHAHILRRPASDPKRVKLAREVFNSVIEVDPSFAGGYAGVALMNAFSVWWGYSQNPEEELETATRSAGKAIEIDPYNALAFNALSFVHMARREFEDALKASEKAVLFQPNDPSANARHGFVLCTNSNYKEGIQFAKRAIRLDPLVPRTPYMNILGVCHFHNGQFEKALNVLVGNLERGGQFNPIAQAHIVAAYARLGRYQDAKIQLKILENFDLGFSWKRWIKRSFKERKNIELVLHTIRDVGSE